MVGVVVVSTLSSWGILGSLIGADALVPAGWTPPDPGGTIWRDEAFGPAAYEASSPVTVDSVCADVLPNFWRS